MGEPLKDTVSRAWPPGGEAYPAPGGWQTPVAVLLSVVGSVLAPLSVVAVDGELSL